MLWVHGTSGEVRSPNIVAGVVLRLVDLQAVGEEGSVRLDLRVAVAEEQLHIVRSHPVEAAQRVGILVWRIEAATEALKRWSVYHRREQILIGAVALGKEEQLVIDEAPPSVPPY